MAICDIVPGLTAEILVNGAALPEIADPDDVQVDHRLPEVAAYQAARTVSKYIEVETDTYFSIRVGVGSPIVKPDEDGRKKMQYTKLRFHIYVDGKLAWISTCGRPFFKNGATSWDDTVDGLKEAQGRNWTIKKFKFAKIQTTDEISAKANVQRQIERIKPVGSIDIRVYSENYGKKGGNVGTSSKGFVKENEKITEKAMKGDAKSHGVALDEPKKVDRGLVWTTVKKDGEEFPLVIFKFMYRDNNVLKILRIIPRTPSPSPSRSRSCSPSVEVPQPFNFEVDNLTPTQRRQFVAFMNSINQTSQKQNKKEIKRIKQEHIEDKDRNRGRKRQRGIKSEVIIIDGDEEEEGEAEYEPLFVSK